MNQIKRDLLETALLSVTVFLVLHFSVQNFGIDGSSMHPTLIHEQHVIVSKMAYLHINPSALLRFAHLVEKTEEGVSLITSDQPEYSDVIAFVYPVDPTHDVNGGDIIYHEGGSTA